MQRGIITTAESGMDLVVEWKIDDFFNLPERHNVAYESSHFSFGGERWWLEIHPNGSTESDSASVDLELFKCDTNRSITQSFSLSLKTAEGKKYKEQYFSKDFDNDNWFQFNRFISRSELSSRRSKLVPEGDLTVICTMKNSTTAGSDSAQSLCEDYKKVLFYGRDHNLILKVGDKELRAHRDILRARSRVFKSMLDYDMKEKNTGIIDVPDCNPKAMELFLSYVYCGKIEALDHNNMLGLYYVADKYEMMELKKECCNFIKKSLSITNICSVIQLALKHSDSDLLEYVTGYFSDNMLDIMQTVEWQSFHKDNFTEGNELLMKSIKILKNAQACI